MTCRLSAHEGIVVKAKMIPLRSLCTKWRTQNCDKLHCMVNKHFLVWNVLLDTPRHTPFLIPAAVQHSNKRCNWALKARHTSNTADDTSYICSFPRQSTWNSTVWNNSTIRPKSSAPALNKKSVASRHTAYTQLSGLVLRLEREFRKYCYLH